MELPKFIQDMHKLDWPLSEDKVKTHVLRSDRGLMIIFDAIQEVYVPPHSHKAQWGLVVEGSVEMTIDGETKVYEKGENYSIGEGVVHSATVRAGSKIMDIFEEPDRYPLLND